MPPPPPVYIGVVNLRRNILNNPSLVSPPVGSGNSVGAHVNPFSRGEVSGQGMDSEEDSTMQQEDDLRLARRIIRRGELALGGSAGRGGVRGAGILAGERIMATSSNRISISQNQRRRLSPSDSAATLTARQRKFITPSKAVTPHAKPFDVPKYLQHSIPFSHRYFTMEKAREIDQDVTMDTATSVPMATTTGRKSREDSICLPTSFDRSDRSALIELASDGLTAAFRGSAVHGDRDAASIRSNAPVPIATGIYYFEVRIVSHGLSGYIGIGFSDRFVELNRLPGWEKNSYGYHGDDGRTFECSGTGRGFGPKFTTGDVIGCGIDYTMTTGTVAERKAGGRVFYTKNGEMINYAFSNVIGELYPTIGLRTPGEVVEANFGSEPFLFDIDAFVLNRVELITDQIKATSIPASLLLPSPSTSSAHSIQSADTLDSLVASYLLHHGYIDTAQSFCNQITLERQEGSIGSPSTSSLIQLSAASSSERLRMEIRHLILAGETQGAIDRMRSDFPEVLVSEDTSGGILFKLRVRTFVDRVMASSVAKGMDGSKGKGKAVEEEEDMADLVAFGQELHSHYGSDPRLAVQELLQRAFGLLAYDRLEDANDSVRSLLAQEERTNLSFDVNTAILVSQSLPARPALEAMFAQASAVVSELATIGVGGALYVDLKKIVGL